MPQDIKIKDMGIFPYGNVSHNVAKLLRDVDYPVTKAELEHRYGKADVQVDFARKVPFSDILAKLPPDNFPTGTSLFTALHSMTY
ncbi:MAG: hypothetical protein LBS30_06515 [Planctomycetota bacterium]|nr:hypothetical protein [Planctomycetota bacterium]